MYCPGCGTEITRGLNYCNRCGATLGAAPLSRLAGLLWTIPIALALISLGGLGMVFIIGFELVRRGAEISTLTAVLLFADVLAVLLIDWMLLRQLTRVIDLYRPSVAPSNQTPRELNGTSFSQIEAPPEPATFVTEQTTRMFSGQGRSH